MAACGEFSSFFSTSLINLKAQSPNGQSKTSAPTEEERTILGGNDYGTFAIPFGTFHQSTTGATSLYRQDSGVQSASASDASPPTVASTAASGGSSDSSSSSSSLSSARGLTSCRQSYANYNGVSILWGRWGSNAYHPGNSSHTYTTAKKSTETVMRNVALPVIAPLSRFPQQRPPARPINILKAPTPPPINIDFSCDDADELLPGETKTEQFFRLAQQHRDQRVRQMDKREREQRRQRLNQPQAFSNGQSGLPVGAATASPPPPPTAFRGAEGMPPLPPRAPHPQQRPGWARYIAAPPSALPAAYPGRPPYNGPYLFESQNVDRAWSSNHPSNNHPNTSAEAHYGSGSSSDSSSSCTDSGASSVSSIPAEERELWGVCPQRDFPLVKSPVWEALDNSHHNNSGDDSTSDTASSSSDEVSSAATSDNDDDEDDAESVEVVVATPPPAMSAFQLPATSRNRPNTATAAASARSEVAMHPLKVHRSHDANNSSTINTSNFTAQSTANLSDSSSSSSSESPTSHHRGGNHRGAPSNHLRASSELTVQPRSTTLHTPTDVLDVAPPCHFEGHREETSSRSERNGSRVQYRPHSPSRVGVTPVSTLRYRRGNGFRRMFKGLI
jgi:hypothetical protein